MLQGEVPRFLALGLYSGLIIVRKEAKVMYQINLLLKGTIVIRSGQNVGKTHGIKVISESDI